MRLSQLASLSLLSLGLFTRHAAANPLPIALAEPLAEPVPQNCPVPCGTNFCCTANQYCRVSGSQCGEGTDPNAVVAGTIQVFTSTYVTTRVDTNVQTIVSVYSSIVTAVNPSVSLYTATWTAPTVVVGGTTYYSSGAVGYPTLTPSVSGSNTFLVPIPTSSSTTDFGYGGIIGTNSPPQGLSSAQIGGIVGGILGAFFLIALILICCCMRRGFNGFFGWMNSWGHQGETTVVHSGGSSGHHGSGHGGHAGLAAATAGGLGYLFGRKASGHHGSSTSHHVVSGGGHHSSGMGKKTGMAALLGGAAAGITSLFASRRKTRMSEKYSTTDTSGYYTSDITDSTSYTGTSSSESSSSSSSSSSSGHPHHGRH
ncbi:hypothetical protein K440DRAFT_658199 [Wilcoxina mikolae CBS 423.85]|nr:hypothetical protein K440DRAFT_658199 [Wilcoxina mikolae CBS 423.85]